MFRGELSTLHLKIKMSQCHGHCFRGSFFALPLNFLHLTSADQQGHVRTGFTDVGAQKHQMIEGQ